jgi:hypothetical protein
VLNVQLAGKGHIRRDGQHKRSKQRQHGRTLGMLINKQHGKVKAIQAAQTTPTHTHLQEAP